MLIIHGTIKGRTKEQELSGPVPTITRTCWSCDDPDTLGWLHNMSTEQEPHSQAQNPPLLYHYPRKHPPFPTDCHGPDHMTSKHMRKRCYPHYSQSCVFSSFHCSPLFYHN